MGVLLNVVTWLTLDLVLYLYVPFLAIILSLFPCFSTSGITQYCGSGVSTFIFPNLNFGNLKCFGVTVKSCVLVDWEKSSFLLLGSPVGVNMDLPLQ